jgi:hypothetical protein
MVGEGRELVFLSGWAWARLNLWPKRWLNGASLEPKNNIFEAKLTNWHRKILLPCQKQGRRVAYNI